MTAQHPRCPECNHLETLHKYRGNYKACTLCKCEVKVKQDVVVDEDESVKYWFERER